MIDFGEWLPDQPDLNSKGLTVAINVIPAARGYRSLRGLTSISNAATNKIQGIFAAKDNAGTVTLFAGDSGKLYKYDAGTNNLVDSSASGGYSIGTNKWRFVQFGDKVLAAGGTGTNLQKYQVGTDSAFSDGAGSPPKAKFIAVVRDQVWTAFTDDGSGNDIPFRTRWSGINDETSWTSGTDQSDHQDIPDAGNITGLVGGQYAVILLERAIAVAQYVGTPLIYQIDRVETARGCKYSGSVANIGRMVFYLSDDGFYSFDGRQSTPIGAEKVNRFWLEDHDSTNTHKMSAAVDPVNQIVCWSYVSNDSTDGEPDRMLVYNYQVQRWSLVNIQAEIIAPFFTSSITMEGLDSISSTLDAMEGTMDALYKGGSFIFGGAINKKLATFSGTTLAATLETQELSLTPKKHTVVTRTVPAFETNAGGAVTMSIGTRNKLDDAVSFSTAQSLTTDGFCPHRDQGRFHRMRMQLTGNWQKAFGVDVEGSPIGRR